MAKNNIETAMERYEKEHRRVAMEKCALRAAENDLVERIRNRKGRPAPKNFTLEEVMRRQTTSEEMEKVKAIREALDLPCEVDPEYRAAKAAYLDAIIPELEKLDARFEKSVAEAECALKAAEEEYEKAMDAADRIKEEMDVFLNPVGLWHPSDGRGAEKARLELRKMERMSL